MQEQVESTEQAQERALHGDVRLHRLLELHDGPLRLGGRGDVTGVVQHHRPHPPRELLPARRLGPHAVQRGVEEPDGDVRLQPSHRVVHSLRVAHVEAPLHQRPVLGDERLGEEGGERVRLGGRALTPERVEHRSVRRGEFLLLRRGGSVDGGVGGGLFDGAEALAQRLAARVLVHVDVVVAHRRRGRHLLGQAVRGRLSLALARASAAAAGRRAVDYSRKRCFGYRENGVGTG